MRRGLLALILLVGFLLRLLYLVQVAGLPIFDDPVGDSAVYLERAAEIREGNLLPDRPFFYGSILYPYLLAGILTLAGGSLFAVCLAQILVGTLFIWILSRLARRIFGRRAGPVAAVLAALYGPFAFLEADILGVAWGMAAMGAGVLWLHRGTGRSSRRRPALYLLLAGLALGLAATERPNLALLAPLAALWAAWRVPSLPWKGGRLSRATAALLVAGGALAALAPVPLLNRAASGQWVLLTTSGGINLFIGNHPGATGTFDEPWSREDPRFTARHADLEESSVTRASWEAGRDLDPVAASGWWARRAGSWVLGHPGEFLGLTFRKVRLLWNAAEFPNHLNFGFMRRQAPALGLLFVGFGILAPLSVVGLATGIRCRERRPGTMLLTVLACGAAASVLPFFVADRYRVPLVLPLLVAAAGGILALVRAVRDRAVRRDPILLAILIPALLLGVETWTGLTRPDLSRDYWLFARAWTREGNHAAAVLAYEEAVRESGEEGVLLNNLGLAYQRAGRRDLAEAALRRAIRADAGLAYPHKNLGLILLSAGDRAEARAELEAALRIDDQDPESLGALALLLAEAGEREEAVRAYRKARQLDPADPRLARLGEEYPFLVEGEVSPPRSRP